MQRFPILIVFILVLAGGAWLYVEGSEGQGGGPSVSSDPAGSSDGKKGSTPTGGQEGPAPKKAAAPGDAPVREVSLPPASKPGRESLRMPDGTWLPVLNGAYGAPAANWPKDIPYSPVIKKVVDKGGLEWYVHKDGSYTITQNEYRADLGRTEPSTTVYNPKKALPMEPSEAKKAAEEMKKQQKN